MDTTVHFNRLDGTRCTMAPISIALTYIDLSMGLWRACNLTEFVHSSTGPVVYLFASRHEGPGFNPQGGTYVKPDSPVSVVPLHW
jgi:hypothetical protein